MKKVHILMVDLKSYFDSPPYQLGLLASYARLEEEVKENVKFTFIGCPRKQPAKEIAAAILAANADLVAASNYAWNYKKICEILNILTNSEAELPRIILGGPNSASMFGTSMMKQYPIISAMVEGEGEPAFRDICSSLVDSLSKDPFINSRNCAIRNEEGNIIKENIGHRIQYLDEVPSPYLTGIIPTNPSPVFYETNRGCPYRCSFCYWGNGNAKIYRMPHERIREELEFFAKNKVNSLWVADANFGIFKDDADIAEIMCEINIRYDYPFKTIGVNWAKNSNEQVLDITSIFKRGRIGCTTTLAIQTVTPEAEEKSKRYSMSPSKFTSLVRSAYQRNLDTYTDIIWGLPGENFKEYLSGLESVISTGVPAIIIRQLNLLPGTEFYDKRKEFGMELLSEVGETVVAPEDRSDYWEYIVVSHPKMSREDMIRGTRIIYINHFLHNHNLGKIVTFYLARYGIKHKQVYNFLDDILLGKVKEFSGQKQGFLSKIKNLILPVSQGIGPDEYVSMREMGNLVWLKKGMNGKFDFNKLEIRKFMHDFFKAFCRNHNICNVHEEMELLKDFIDYNVLISPKPAWKPKPYYSFKYDVHAIWHDMLHQIHYGHSDLADVKLSNGNGVNIKSEKKNGSKKESWRDVSANVRERLSDLLSDEYLEKMRGPVTYRVKNPWLIPPTQNTYEWVASNHSRQCIVSPLN